MASEYDVENTGTVIGADTGGAAGSGADALMPVGQREIGEIRREDVEVSEDGKAEPVFSDDAVAELVWRHM